MSSLGRHLDINLISGVPLLPNTLSHPLTAYQGCNQLLPSVFDMMSNVTLHLLKYSLGTVDRAEYVPFDRVNDC